MRERLTRASVHEIGIREPLVEERLLPKEVELTSVSDVPLVYRQ